MTYQFGENTYFEYRITYNCGHSTRVNRLVRETHDTNETQNKPCSECFRKVFYPHFFFQADQKSVKVEIGSKRRIQASLRNRGYVYIQGQNCWKLKLNKKTYAVEMAWIQKRGFSFTQSKPAVPDTPAIKAMKEVLRQQQIAANPPVMEPVFDMGKYFG